MPAGCEKGALPRGGLRKRSDNGYLPHTNNRMCASTTGSAGLRGRLKAVYAAGPKMLRCGPLQQKWTPMLAKWVNL